MLDNIRKVCIVTLIFLLLNCCTVLAYTGKGTVNNPYVASTEDDLRAIIIELPKKDGWTYIAVNSNIVLKKMITVDGGKYRIYAKGAERTIRRSSDMTTSINEEGNPKYCMKLTNKAEVVVGYDASNYVLKLGGNKSYFSGSNISAGWFNIGSGCKLTIDVNAHLTNSINNENADYSSVVRVMGELYVNGEISNCEGANGGAIKLYGGYVKINSTAKIHNCVSKSEGGAIFASSNAYVEMVGGNIYQCTSAEEGGAIFIGEDSSGDILSGNIYGNYSGKSAGGIFSGYGAELCIGASGTSGPNIYNNQSAGSGGGIRCNGGTTEYAGGTSYFYSGRIYDNESGNLGGGIACGAAGSKGYSKISIQGMYVENNSSDDSGGGIWLAENATGITTVDIQIQNTYITGNTAHLNGGGLLTNTKVTTTNVYINNNRATNNGGGVSITDTGVFHYKGNQITGNVANNKGNGVYVKGKFVISDNGKVDSANEVYLTVGTYVEVQSGIVGSTALNTNIKSAVTTNGTKVVKVNYGSKDSETELYYSGNAETERSGETVIKRYVCINLSGNQCLRSAKYVTGIDNEWIIISDKYSLSYNKNTGEEVSNMPDAINKYWNENVNISNNQISRKGYITDEDKHWNTSTNGTGTVIKPGGIYDGNSNLILYAQWIQVSPTKLYVEVTDRYYVVGQDIELTVEEILRKIKITDDLNSANKYLTEVRYIAESSKGRVAAGYNLETEKYIDTSEEKHFVITFVVSNESGELSKTAKINVYILQGDTSIKVVRFISSDYLYTLSESSKWNNRLNEQLVASLCNNKGDRKIILSSEEIKLIKDNLKSNNYIISKSMNQNLIGSW